MPVPFCVSEIHLNFLDNSWFYWYIYDYRRYAKKGVSMVRSKMILTAKEVAEYLHIHLLTVHRYAREGRIPAFKIGTDWRFHKKYLEQWIKQKVSSNFDSRKHNVGILEKV